MFLNFGNTIICISLNFIRRDLRIIDFFSGAMDARGDDISDTASNYSDHSARSKFSKRSSVMGGKPMNMKAKAKAPEPEKQFAKVSKLRPKQPITCPETMMLHEVAEMMAAKRADAALLLGAKGNLSGVITDNDMTRRARLAATCSTTLPNVGVTG